MHSRFEFRISAKNQNNCVVCLNSTKSNTNTSKINSLELQQRVKLQQQRWMKVEKKNIYTDEHWAHQKKKEKTKIEMARDNKRSTVKSALFVWDTNAMSIVLDSENGGCGGSQRTKRINFKFYSVNLSDTKSFLLFNWTKVQTETDSFDSYLIF